MEQENVKSIKQSNKDEQAESPDKTAAMNKFIKCEEGT